MQWEIVYDWHHYFGIGPISKPKPKLVDSFSRYHDRYQNFTGQLTDTLLYDKCPVTHASTPINIKWGNATILFQNWNLNWSILSADTKTDSKTLADNLPTHCSTINVQSPTHLFLSIWNEVIKVRLSQKEFMKLSILENSNWKIWRFSALASKMRSNKKRVPIF